MIRSMSIFVAIFMIGNIFISQQAIAQNDGSVGIGTETPDPSAILDATSTTKGFLPPCMTESQRDAIGNPADGLIISCTNCDIPGLHQYINGVWQALAQSQSNSTGNYGTVVNLVTGKVWLDRNLGATQVATSSTDVASYGDLYQWGRAAEGHQLRTSAITATQATDWYAGVWAWKAQFVTTYNNWLSTGDEVQMWSGSDAENNPCPSGFRVPTIADWEQERQTWSSNDLAGAFASVLKLPAVGRRYSTDGTLNDVGSSGYYWSSTAYLPSTITALNFVIFSSSAQILINNRADGASVRCIKD